MQPKLSLLLALRLFFSCLLITHTGQLLADIKWSSVEVQGWSISQRVSPLTGITETYTQSQPRSPEHQRSGLEAANLILECRDSGPRVSLTWKRRLDSGDPFDKLSRQFQLEDLKEFLIRIDQDPSRTVPVSYDPKAESLILSQDLISEFLADMYGKNKLYIRATHAEAEFDLAGLQTVIHDLHNECFPDDSSLQRHTLDTYNDSEVKGESSNRFLNESTFDDWHLIEYQQGFFAATYNSESDYFGSSCTHGADICHFVYKPSELDCSEQTERKSVIVKLGDYNAIKTGYCIEFNSSWFLFLDLSDDFFNLILNNDSISIRIAHLSTSIFSLKGSSESIYEMLNRFAQ